MPFVGPALPPHLATKRKMRNEENEEPSQLKADSLAVSVSSNDEEKRRKVFVSSSSTSTSVRIPSLSLTDNGHGQRVVGPSLPPAPSSERPPTPSSPQTKTADISDSESDSDLGPALPPPPSSSDHHSISAQIPSTEITSSQEPKPQREEWMLVPPLQADWSTRVDPTKLKNRKFNTGKGAKAPAPHAGGDNALWTETAEEKRQRLEDEVMGVRRPAQLESDNRHKKANNTEIRETEKRLKEYNEKNRASSLYAEHKKTVPKEKEDDPSKRAFDREKDIGGGLKIGHAKRKELLTRAADFGSRFEKGSYL